MEITRPFTFPNIKPAFQIVKPLLDLEGNIIEDLCISDHSNLYNYCEVQNSNFISECSILNKYYTYINDKNGRTYARGKLFPNNKQSQLARLTLLTFDMAETGRPLSYYDNLEVDHISPARPLDESLKNLRFVDHDTNMDNAGLSGVMIKKYKKPLIHQVCQMLCEGKERAEIAKVLNIPPQLVDDIHSGRSHKCVSRQYLDKGFSYQNYPRRPREERLKEAHEICKLMSEGYGNKQICRMLGVASGLVTSIAAGVSYKDVSSQYDLRNYCKLSGGKGQVHYKDN